MRKFFHPIRNILLIVAHFLSNNTAAAPLPNHYYVKGKLNYKMFFSFFCTSHSQN